MPKIDAATVAEHRANQEDALLGAARELLLSKGRGAVTPAAVGAAAGLARSSVYKYFRSGEEILERIVGNAFADWAAVVREAVDAVDGADRRVAAYVRTSLALAGSGAHRVAVLGGGVPRDEGARERIARAHRMLAEPLREALAERGDPDPALTADLIDGAIGRAIDRLDAGADFRHVRRLTMAFVERAVGIDSQLREN
ncbi:TetR/AcrR family transcriptional regulator [Nocardia acidivorans]|uniref:TetR/AcrR family transcriptional regulator n=1 Tax=Nocardia acidivorans TaxID=404580 RepID=UPI0008356A97|nr:TetR family transcriptional regulator [Nocardia acidivorans]